MGDPHAIAKLLLEARAGGAPVDARPDNAPDDPYAVQDIVVRALSHGRRTAVWKAIPPRAGSPQLASPVPAPCIWRSPARVAAGHGFLGVEAEIAFSLDEHLAPAAALVLIEVCATRLADWQRSPAVWKLADFQSNGACVLGTGTPAWRAIDFAQLRAEVLINGKLAASAVGAHPSRDPSTLVAGLVQHAATRGGVQPGDVVATGSWTGIVKCEPGDEIVARFPGVGEASVTLG